MPLTSSLDMEIDFRIAGYSGLSKLKCVLRKLTQEYEADSQKTSHCTSALRPTGNFKQCLSVAFTFSLWALLIVSFSQFLAQNSSA